jgi:hypothetical protein
MSTAPCFGSNFLEQIDMKTTLRIVALAMALFFVKASATAQGFPPVPFNVVATSGVGSALNPLFTTNLILTQATNTSPATGAGWVYFPQITLTTNGFSAFFQFQMTPGTNAQGLAFAIQPVFNGALGNGGAGLGYDGLSNCIAVAFVQQPSAALGQPAYPFVSIQSGAGKNNTNSANISHSIGISSNNPALNFADGKVHTAIVSFGPSSPPTNIAVFLDGSSTPVAQAPFSNSQLFGMSTNGQFFFGFTSASLPGQPVQTEVLDLGLLETTRPQITVTVPGTFGVVGVPMVISVQASNGVPSLPASLSVSNLPTGATCFPALPLSGTGTIATTINWTAQSTGTNKVIFSATINGVTTNSTNYLVVLPASAAASTNQAFDINTSGATTNLQILGNATLLTNGFRLTKTGDIQNSSAVWWKAKEPLCLGFSTHFQFQMGGDTNTKGLAFVIQDSSLAARGPADVSRGFAGIDHSLAVEFVPNPSSTINEPNYQFISVQSAFASPNSANYTYSLGVSPSPSFGYTPVLTLNDGQLHTVDIVLSPTNSGISSIPQSRWLYVYVDGGYESSPGVRTFPQCQVQINVDQLNTILANGQAWVGFTSATGSAPGTNTDILNWTFTPYVAPTLAVNPAIPTAVLSGSPITFTVTATAVGTNADVRLMPMSLPAGATVSPRWPSTISAGQSGSSTFTWTPGLVTQPTTNRIAFAAVIPGGGSQTSLSVDTVVYPPPTLNGQYTNGNFRLGFSSVSNLSFTVYTTTNLFSNWTVLPIPVTQTSPGQYQAIDTNTPAATQRFYQIRSP